VCVCVCVCETQIYACMCAEMLIICEVCVDWVSVRVFSSLGAELSVKHLVADG